MLAEKIKDRIRLMAIIDSFGERGERALTTGSV